MSTVQIQRRFRGPPETGNGGYVAGIVAAAVGGSNCVVTLKAPIPLDRDLSLVSEDRSANLYFNDDVIVSASGEPVDIDVPPPPTLDEARAAEPLFVGHSRHSFPGCFVCGPDRSQDDGMRIFPGPLNDSARQVAASWTPDASLADESGHVRPEFIWAALDCPGYFAAESEAGLALLGRMAAVIHLPVPVDRPLIVTGWPIDHDGRKHRVGSALHDCEGRLLAAATATWITLREERAA